MHTQNLPSLQRRNERARTAKAYLMQHFDAERAQGFYQMPSLEAETFIPERLIGFNYVLNSQSKGAGVHFYLDDYQFERIWREPLKYIEALSAFDCVLTPDFSLYRNMSMALKVWNVYRSRLIGQIYQDCGLTVIPTLSWAEPETFDFCFDGLEAGGTVSVSTIGVKHDKEASAIWRAGMDEAIRRLQPSTVLVYGCAIDYDFGRTKAIHYANEVTVRWKKRSAGDIL